MLSARLRKNWALVTVLLSAAMLAVLAGLQFTWTGQLSRAQAEMMQNALDNSIRQFEQVVQRELAYLLVRFQPRVRGARQDRWDQYAGDYALWARTTSYPAMLRRVLFHRVNPDGTEVLQELPLGQSEPISIAWSPELEDLLAAVDSARKPGIPTWVADPSTPAIIRNEVILGPRRRGADRFQPPGTGTVILIPDWDYITGTALPELVRRLFGGRDGEQLYHVAIAAEPYSRVLYRSDPSIGTAWLDSADRRRRLRVTRDSTAQGQGNTGRPVAGSLGGPRATARTQEVTWRPGLGLRPRIQMASGEPVPRLIIAAAHASGSLGAVVERQRMRNLAAGLGVLLVLAGAMALVLVSARRAEQLAGMKMDFIASVTHELRTPLSVIRSVGDNLAEGVVQSAQQVRRYGELVRDQGGRLSLMVEQTLQFAALEAGKRQFHLVDLDLVTAVDRALERARPMIEQAGFSLERGDDLPMPQAKADEEAVQQILANLLSNAVKYGEPGRWLRVETAVGSDAPHRTVQVRVLDRGKGISPSEASRVFDAFYRGAAAEQGRIRGSGLGLNLARDLARGMGGNLSFRSKPGEGSVFTLLLPALPDVQA